jgi:cobalt-zinc-cadmium efflux system membrane fusion protein
MGGNNPICQVESLRIRFLDSTIVQKAGIQVEKATRKPMSATIALPAEVEFNATRMTRITPRAAGVVRNVPANVGDEIKVGDLLAVIESPALGEAKNEYIKRAQNLRLAQSDLNRIGTIARGVHRMLEICTADASAEEVRRKLKDSPVGEAKAKLLRAQAALQLARAEAEREAMLLEKNVSSQRDYQAARSALTAGEADFAAIREELAFKIQRSRQVAERAGKIAKTALESAERRLKILGLTHSQIEIIGNEPDEQLSRFELRSPASGRVIERSVAVGESVDPNDELFLLADLSTMWLVADAYERDLSLLGRGHPVLFTVDGMPGMSFEGKVSWISSQVDDRTRTIRVRADLPNPKRLLRAKMFGKARIVVRDQAEVVTIPGTSVQTDGCCQIVFTQASGTTFQPRKVALGASGNGFVEILSGLQEGESVASVGSFLMKTEILKGNIGAGCCEVDPGR